MISIVVPTYNEAAVIEETLRRAGAALRTTGQPFELIVVDDSSADGTAKLAEALGRELPVRVVRRPGRLGLATAILDGWTAARGDMLGAMDADLQHPPEVLADLVRAMAAPDVDLVIASRYVAGGGTADWSRLRRAASWGATHLAACVLPLTLAEVSDPLSGMFLIRASALEGVRLSPLGYKILLEILAKARYRRRIEIPYVFEERGRGSSKLGPQQYCEYLIHLMRLARSTGQLDAWLRYAVVALTGAVINIVMLYWLVEHAGWRPGTAIPLAIQTALLSNFFWNETLTFSRRRVASQVRPSLLQRLWRYEKICVPGAVLNGGVTFVLIAHGVAVWLAALVGVISGSILNLLFNIPAIWRVWGTRLSPGGPSSP